MKALRNRRLAAVSTRGVSLLFACISLWLPAVPAQAEYRVELDAPKPLRDLLTDYLDLFRYRKRDDINADQLNFMIATAPEQVQRLTSTEGYFSPKTTVEVDRSGATPLVRMKVDPGRRTTISKADIAVVGAASQQASRQVERLRRGWELKAGEPFRQEEWDAAKQAGLQVLQRRRFAAAKIADSRAVVNADDYKAELSVSYDSGPVFTLGEVKIDGASRYPEEIIRNVNPLKVGEEYSAERLLEYQRQVLRTPYYSNVIIDIDKDPAKAELTPVEVKVTEFPKQRIRGGLGYTTDTGTRVDGRYSHNDMFRRAWVLDTQLAWEEKRQFGSLELAMPPDDKAFVNRANGSIERTTLEGIDLRSRRLGLRRARQTDKRDLAYSIEYFNDRLQPIDDPTAQSDTIIEPGVQQALVFGVEQTRRQVNNPTFPRDGRIITLQAGVAVRGLLTDESFLRLYGRIREYIPVGRRHLVILRAEAGSVIVKGGDDISVPASLLFRAGGTDSVRGYAYQSIGDERGGTVYPTKAMATGSVEYQHWFDKPIFNQQLGAAVFYDVGTASNHWNDGTLYQGVGVGARWRSPVGRVNLDIAYGLKDKSVRPHLSLGVAF